MPFPGLVLVNFSAPHLPFEPAYLVDGAIPEATELAGHRVLCSGMGFSVSKMNSVVGSVGIHSRKNGRQRLCFSAGIFGLASASNFIAVFDHCEYQIYTP